MVIQVIVSQGFVWGAILAMRPILYFYEELTMKEIGTTLDLSERRVSQMHSGLVQRLQQQLQYRRREFAA